MKFLGLEIGRSEKRMITSVPGLERPGANVLQVLGLGNVALQAVTVESALRVPAMAGGVGFLSSSLANLPLHVYKTEGESNVRAGGPLQRILNEAPNAEWSSFGFRKYFWSQVFTGGRGLAWIERSGTNIVGIWPFDPLKVTVKLNNGRKTYHLEGKSEPYAASEVIDIPFLLKPDQVGSYSPITLGEKALQLALAMNDYGSQFFNGGGVPPLAVVGPPAANKEAMTRALKDIQRSVDAARETGIPIAQLPPGYELKPIGYEPEKGQMTEARLFQIQEIGRVLNLPPAFLQDLSRGTFSNTEQQDLHLVKHLLAHWAKAFEDELNLKLFGAKRNVRYVEHNLDGLMRGDFKSRMEALSAATNSALLTPDEARALDNRPPKPNGDKLYMQGATVELGSTPKPAPQANGDANGNGTQGAA